MSDLERDLRPSRTSGDQDGHFQELSGQSETAGAVDLECADLSALWYAATCRRDADGFPEVAATNRGLRKR